MSDSSEAFTPDELALIIEEASALGEDVQHLIDTLLFYGIHPSLIPKISGEDVKVRRLDGKDALYLDWLRTKTDAQDKFPVVPAHESWLPNFLDRTPFGSRWSIDRQLTRIQDRLEKRGYTINVCARRFRHTCAVLMIVRGVPEPVVRQLMRITPKTLETYGRFRFEAVYKDLVAKRWGSL